MATAAHKAQKSTTTPTPKETKMSAPVVAPVAPVAAKTGFTFSRVEVKEMPKRTRNTPPNPLAELFAESVQNIPAKPASGEHYTTDSNGETHLTPRLGSLIGFALPTEKDAKKAISLLRSAANAANGDDSQIGVSISQPVKNSDGTFTVSFRAVSPRRAYTEKK